MKPAVSHREQFMERSDTATRESNDSATVKGDVHDIGKTPVETSISDDRYEVVNLEIEVRTRLLTDARHPSDKGHFRQ